ncbi:Rha family transcriptional regulator [Listeria monocytogenes]|uniref:Rha family transcriptional regulator n=1 Tax=Listeria monocytogenes TaxID=1639 RepID=UPI003B42ED9F
MNNLAVLDKNNTLNSREVAEMVEKRHSDLLRDIETYIRYINQNAKLRSDDFFSESTYQAGTGKDYKCYEITKMGCEMIANKLTGAKGIQFTALFVQKFNKLEAKEMQTFYIPGTYAEALTLATETS